MLIGPGQTLRSRSTEYQTNLLQRFSKEALPKLLKGHYELVIHEVNRKGSCVRSYAPDESPLQVLPWEKIVEATEMMEGSQNTGKIVCTIGDQSKL